MRSSELTNRIKLISCHIIGIAQGGLNMLRTLNRLWMAAGLLLIILENETDKHYLRRDHLPYRFI